MNFNNNLMTTIGKSKRLFPGDTTEYCWFPGVGAYNIELLEPFKTRGNSFTRAKRHITVDDGSYSRRKDRSDSNEMKPGPGSYSIELKRNNKLLTFPHSKRFVTDNFRHPGPGAYRAQDSSRDKIKAGIIARSKRSTTNMEYGLPGPSDYSIPALIKYKKREPTILIGRAKRQNSQQETIPGPGSYNISRQINHKQRATFYDTNNQKRGTMENIWHGRRIEKQAKMVKDQLADYKH